ncbi:MAG: ribonuclease HII [Clostridiaceae bacterium]|nr:ribonuclease HII [Clostridiaceae bacterium]
MSKARLRVEERYRLMDAIEAEQRERGLTRLAGVDEAGRGPLAGPVYAAACILDPNVPIYGLNDSKRLSERKREELFEVIVEQAADWGIGWSTVDEIEHLGVLAAVHLAMRRALDQLRMLPEIVLVDYERIPGVDLPQINVTKGDARVNCIAAASILAKVARDRYMIELAERYPDYGFEKHKGYGTAQHIAAIREAGPTKEHRRSFLTRILQPDAASAERTCETGKEQSTGAR